MPCYCDIPDESDQVEIERRCKVKMYFDVQTLLTSEQIDKSQKIGISALPLPDENTSLCKLCGILDKEQMEKISAHYFQIKWSHKTLYDWYLQHCKDDELQYGFDKGDGDKIAIAFFNVKTSELRFDIEPLAKQSGIPKKLVAEILADALLNEIKRVRD